MSAARVVFIALLVTASYAVTDPALERQALEAEELALKLHEALGLNVSEIPILARKELTHLVEISVETMADVNAAIESQRAHLTDSQYNTLKELAYAKVQDVYSFLRKEQARQESQKAKAEKDAARAKRRNTASS